MKKIMTIFVIICAGVLIATPVFAKAVLVDAASIKYNDVPGFAGVHTATVEGDAAESSPVSVSVGVLAPREGAEVSDM